MSMKEFLRRNRDLLDQMIQAASPGSPRNDHERELRVRNDQSLYWFARRSGVRV